MLSSHSCTRLPSSLFFWSRFSHPPMQFSALLRVSHAPQFHYPHIIIKITPSLEQKITKLTEFSPALFYSSVFHRILSQTSSESICIDTDTLVIFAPRDSSFLETELRTSSANISTQRHKFCDTLFILF